MPFLKRWPLADTRQSCQVLSRVGAAATVTALLALLGPDVQNLLGPTSPALFWGALVLIAVLSALLGYAAIYRLIRLYNWVVLHTLRSDRVTPHLSRLVAGNAPDDPSSPADLQSWHTASRIYDRYLQPTLQSARNALHAARQPVGDEPSIHAVVSRLTARWLDPPLGSTPRTAQTLIDPIHGLIRIDDELAALLFHPIVQRLHEIRQLAFAFPSHPGATHSRLSHSLGVAHLAASVMRTVIDENKLYTSTGIESIDMPPEERHDLVKLAAAAGLVHDVGHTPLGHSLDQLLGTKYLRGATRVDKSLLASVVAGPLAVPLEAAGIEPERVARLFSKDARGQLTGWEYFLAWLLDSHLDVDRLDYLVRDAHFSGQQEGLLNINTYVAGIRPFARDERVFLSFDTGFISHIEQFIYARDIMYLRTYERPEKVVSERLAVRGIVELLDSSRELREQLLERFALLSDQQLLACVSVCSGSEVGVARDLLNEAFRSEALLFGEVTRLPCRAAAFESESHLEALVNDWSIKAPTVVDKQGDIEQSIADAAGVEAREVVVTLPETKLAEERSEPVIYILVEEDNGFRTEKLLDPRTGRSASDILAREEYVRKSMVLDATELELLKGQVETEGFSLLKVLRDARAKLRVFLHRRRWDRREAVEAAVGRLSASAHEDP